MSEPQKTPGRRNYRSVVGVAALFLLGLLATAGVKSYRDLKAARDLEANLERRIVESEARIRVLTEHVRRIEEDPLALERLAREELGMVKPGDVVIVLPEDSDPPPDGRPPDGRSPDS